MKRLLSLHIYVAKYIHNYDNTTRVAQHNAQYATLSQRQVYSTVYYIQNNSRVYEIMLANEILALLRLFLCLWSVGSDERPKMQGGKYVEEIIMSNIACIQIGITT